jgi:hypothetical protein
VFSFRARQFVVWEVPSWCFALSFWPSLASWSAVDRACRRISARSSGVRSCCFWNGFYVGVHGGYASGTLLPPTRNTGLASDISLSGRLRRAANRLQCPGVAELVLRRRAGHLVWKDNPAAPASRFRTRRSASKPLSGATVRGRFGYVMGRHALFYSTAGVAWALNRGSLDFHTPAQQAAAGADHLAYSEQHCTWVSRWATESNGPSIGSSASRRSTCSVPDQGAVLRGNDEGAVAGFHDHTFRVGLNWRMR